MSKRAVSKLFLYKYRFIIGYVFLGLAFLLLLFGMPLVTPGGLSTAELDSTVTSFYQTEASLTSGNIVDLPYHLLQRFCIHLFGLNSYTIKLPSIIIGFFLGLTLIMLLNRWFKNNVAILACIVTVLSSSFLFIAGNGTPLIMFVFWPTLLLWLGSKIANVKHPRPLYSFLFAFALLGSLFTPYLIYLALFILIYVAVNPHLRFTIKTLPRLPFILVSTLIAGGCTFIIMHLIETPDTLKTLMLASEGSNYFQNIGLALTPFFSWNSMVENTFLAPLISLPTFTLATIGLISTARGFSASRNSIATYLIIFSLIICGLSPSYAILLILPVAILVAHGLRYILNKWYSIFPENPYARVFGVLPIGAFLFIMIVSDLSHFFFGYRYNPPVANQFLSDLSLLEQTSSGGDTLLVRNSALEFDFYSIYATLNPIFGPSHTVNVTKGVPTSIPPDTRLLTFGKPPENSVREYNLTRIITSDKSQNSDRIYVYELRSPENSAIIK